MSVSFHDFLLRIGCIIYAVCFVDLLKIGIGAGELTFIYSMTRLIITRLAS